VPLQQFYALAQRRCRPLADINPIIQLGGHTEHAGTFLLLRKLSCWILAAAMGYVCRQFRADVAVMML
jgi:hypothetical protein